MQNKSKIGLVLVVVGVIVTFLWWYSAGYVFLSWYWSYRISFPIFATLMVIPSVGLTVAGLALYLTGRNEYWKAAQRRRGLLSLLGLALMLLGAFFSWWFYAFAVYAADKLGPPYAKPVTHYLATSSPYFILFALWIVSGLMIFADAIEAILTRKQSSASL